MYGVLFETQTNAESGDQQLSLLLNEFWDNAWKYIYDYDTQGKKYINKPTKIVIHHTADETCDPIAYSKWHRDNPTKGTNWLNSSTVKLWDWSNSDVRYHYIVQKDGTIDEVRKPEEVGRGTKLNNINSIHIAICWNFVNEEPTAQQYNQAGLLMSKLRDSYGPLPVEWHGHLDGEHTSCPGQINFDKFNYMVPIEVKTQKTMTDIEIVHNAELKTKVPKLDTCQLKQAKKWMKCLGLFDEITAYYTPLKDQGRYFAPNGKNQRTYEQEKAINGDLTPAN